MKSGLMTTSPVDGSRYRKALVELFLESGKYSFRIGGDGVDQCFTREMPAVVEKTDATTTIEPAFPQSRNPSSFRPTYFKP